jgi:hypothetical protein
MSVKDKAQGVFGGAVADRLAGHGPGAFRAAAGAVIAGGATTVVVYRLLHKSEDDN